MNQEQSTRSRAPGAMDQEQWTRSNEPGAGHQEQCVAAIAAHCRPEAALFPKPSDLSKDNLSKNRTTCQRTGRPVKNNGMRDEVKEEGRAPMRPRKHRKQSTRIPPKKRPRSLTRKTAVSSAKDRGLSAKRPRSFFAPSASLQIIGKRGVRDYNLLLTAGIL